ncbi:MAG: hypothetical protein CMP22_08135 [Rickettsiales bacterium]|nr:hypothetical protein [Rickettsiales bacterium]|tara:strand:+ start:2221 stop:2505 length:285 start_codon:yes stop_codon:yes gene_type:complete
MKAEVILTNDGRIVFACEETLEAPISSVEFYKDTGSFIFNYEGSNQGGEDTVMLDIEVAENFRNLVASSSMALVTFFTTDNQTHVFDVPFIHVG